MQNNTIYRYVMDEVHPMTFNEDVDSLTKLVPGIYSIAVNEGNFFLRTCNYNKFKTPSQIYGNELNKVDRIMNTYNDRVNATGIAFTGDKGTGKTMISELVANRCIENSIPVILVNQKIDVPGIAPFINKLGEICIIFDEFAKNIGEKQQNELLNIFDGTISSTKRLILLTENKERNINEFFKARPGRIFYHYRYNKLEELVIQQYCEFHNIDKSIIDNVMNFARIQKIFTFDILQAIVEEIKRYPSYSIEEITNDLNVGDDIIYDTFEILKIESLNPERISFKNANEFSLGQMGDVSVSYNYINDNNVIASVKNECDNNGLLPEEVQQRIIDKYVKNQSTPSTNEKLSDMLDGPDDFGDSVMIHVGDLWVSANDLKYENNNTYIFEIPNVARIIAKKKLNNKSYSLSNNYYAKLLQQYLA